MAVYRDASIKRKLTSVILCTCALGLSLASMAIEIYERASFRESMISGLAANADSLGQATAASLTFEDKKFAEQTLGTIRSEHYVMAVILYAKSGKVFAEYRRSGLGAEFKTPTWKEEGTQFDQASLTVYRNISLDGGKAGSIAIVSDLSELQSKMRQYRKISALVLLVSILLTFVISSRLVGLITQPILHLAEVAGRVSAQKDYTLRAVLHGRDEVGRLVEAFNQMLTGIQERDAALQGAKVQLEARVQERTEELRNEVKERQEAEAAMRLAKDAAESASKAKSEFLANMSHEIRTPLNGVMGMTDLALETNLTQEQREYLETVKTSSEALLVVVNDILDFSKIEAGRVELESAEFDMRDCLESALRTVAIRADEKGLELLCEVAPEVPEVVKGDAGRLRQVVINLVGNAIKFTDAGEVAVRVQAETQNGAKGLLHFTVSDTGIGIPADKCEAIFAPFTQADSSTTRKYGGTGLGLTISNRLVAMMGGAMWVESELGKGSHFHFTAHLTAANAKGIKVGAPAPPEILRGVKVLVVDDNRTNRRILEGMLKHWGMTPVTVESGDLALAQLSEAREAGEAYRLVLTDMHMPKMDGFALVEQIRQRPELSTATIMMLTSAGHRGDAERCKELGVSAYLLKPIRQSELREAVARVLGATEPEGAIPLITRYSLQDAREPGSSLKVLLAEDNAVNQRLVVRLLEKRGHHVVVAANGLEALAALKHENFDLVLMDVQMPEMDGMEATVAIRAGEKRTGEHLAVIALTAHAMKGDRDKCLAAGMDGYLTKPIRTQELDDVLEECLKKRHAKTRALAPVEQIK